jgi:hypothetical protein
MRFDGSHTLAMSARKEHHMGDYSTASERQGWVDAFYQTIQTWQNDLAGKR